MAMQTRVRIKGRKFLINDRLTYSEIPGGNPACWGLLWNQRMIQGVFDDAGHRERYQRPGTETFAPDANTDALIAALPEWYRYGLRAVTVGFQGGWPVGLSGAECLCNNPFGEDGLTLDAAYAARMDRVIRAADALGMAVIVNHLYWAQAKRLRDGQAVRDAVITASHFLRDGGYTNVLVDVANEYDISLFADHPIVNTPEGVSTLIELARRESGGVPTGSSGGGGTFHLEVARASDFVLFHGNGLSRGAYADLVSRMRRAVPNKPLVCNEDSPCITRVEPSLHYEASWGYYNNYTKQIPPSPWGVLPGEDLFYARRVARTVGLPVEPLEQEDCYILQGLAPWEAFGDGLHCMRLAAEFPETVEYVVFKRDGIELDVSYDEPFLCRTEATWLGESFQIMPGEMYSAQVHLVDGRVLEKHVEIV